MPPQYRGDVQFFQSDSTTGSNTTPNWRTWIKPRGCSMLYIVALGGGGGGGAGFTRTAGNAGGGGGSGGSAAMMSAILPAFFVPEELFIQVGHGGLGGSGNGVDGKQGLDTSVAVGRNTNAPTTIVRAPAGTGGTTGTGAAAGSAGSGGTATTTTFSSFSSAVGILKSLNGTSGQNGGSQAGANGQAAGSIWGSEIVGGGGGGAGCTTTNFNGGAINFTTNIEFGGWTISSLAGGVGGAAVDGNAGIQLLGPQYPLFMSGGSGGGSNNSGVAGIGGKGGWGCGGGGGGAGATGGKGGDGGNGFVLICAW